MTERTTDGSGGGPMGRKVKRVRKLEGRREGLPAGWRAKEGPKDPPRWIKGRRDGDKAAGKGAMIKRWGWRSGVGIATNYDGVRTGWLSGERCARGVMGGTSKPWGGPRPPAAPHSTYPIGMRGGLLPRGSLAAYASHIASPAASPARLGGRGGGRRSP